MLFGILQTILTLRDTQPTQHRNHTSRQRQFKTGIPQGVSFHPHYFKYFKFTPQTYHHRAPVQIMAYADDITITQVQPRNTYNHTYIKFLPGHNKTTSY